MSGNGEIIAIGAQADNTNGVNSGLVKVFKRGSDKSC